jgi:hypothetical protein
LAVRTPGNPSGLLQPAADTGRKAADYGGPRPHFRIERVNAVRHMREFKDRMAHDYGIVL